MRGEAGQPRGFTLIEVLIVVAVIGVMAFAAAPAVDSFTGANARSAAGVSFLGSFSAVMRSGMQTKRRRCNCSDDSNGYGE